MSKLVDKGSHYEVQPDFGEQLLQIMGPLMDLMTKKRIAKKAGEKEAEDIVTEQSKLMTSLANLAEQNPEMANQLQDLPSIAAAMDPSRSERARHSDEGLLTRMRHKDKHAEMDRVKSEFASKKTKFEVSPQLEHARAKAKHEAARADAQRQLEESKTTLILDGLKNGDIVSKIIATGQPVNDETLRAYADPKKGISAANTKVPYSKEWIADKMATNYDKVFSEHPDATPEQVNIQMRRRSR
jgi:hypothetical protein